MPSIEWWSRRGDKALLREHPGSEEVRHAKGIPTAVHPRPAVTVMTLRSRPGERRAASWVVGLVRR